MPLQTTFVFIAYVALFNWIIVQIPFFKKSGLPLHWITWLFSLKLIAGLAYAWFYSLPAYYAGSDTWNFFRASKTETDWLLRDPLGFFRDIFTSGYGRSGNLFTHTNSYWNDLKNNFVIKLLAVCNVFTLKNYFADIVVFNFLSFFGPVALYRSLKKIFRVNNLVLGVSIFLIPSFLFWCSGVHKDGLIFSCLGLIIFHFERQISLRSIKFPSMVILITCLAVLFALRNFLVFLLLPSLLIWHLTILFPAKAKALTLPFCGIGIVLFFLSGKISPQMDLPHYIIEKQGEFKQLSGNSAIAVPPLEDNVASFLRFLPSAIDIAFFRPHLTEYRSISSFFAAIEVLLFWGIVILALPKRKHKATTPQISYICFCLFFSVSFLLICGYTIPFSGAIVRYRAIVLPLLLTLILPRLDWIKTIHLKHLKTSRSN